MLDCDALPWALWHGHGLPALGGPIATCVHGHVHFRYGLAKAGQPLMVRVRCMPTDMSVSRFGMGKDGQPLVARLQRVPHGVFVLCIGLAKGGKPLMDHVRRNPGVMFVLA